MHLSHVDELGEDLRSLLGRVSAEDHQLHPLGDAVAHHNGALQSRVVPHRAMHHVAAVVQELRPSQRVTGSSCSDADQIHLSRHLTPKMFTKAPELKTLCHLFEVVR